MTATAVAALLLLASASTLQRSPRADARPLPDTAAFPGDGAVSVGSEHVHDPTIVRIGGKWFGFSTSGNGFGVVRSSPDLKTWTVHGPLKMPVPAWLAGRYTHRSIWAPDILVVGSEVRCYYSASQWGTNRSVIGLAKNARFDPARPDEGWTDGGLVIESKSGEPFNAIDPETFVDASGTHRLVYGSYFGGIATVELDAATGLRKNAEAPVLLARNTGENGNPLEGAAVLRRKGFYYLFVSYGLAAQGVRSTYRIMVGRSDSPTGPYIGRAGKSMAEGGHTEVLKGSPPMFSPGHSDILIAPDGRTLMPYHFYDGRSYWTDGKWGLPRLQIREIHWDAEGWPLPGQPIERPHPSGPSESPKPGIWTLQSDFAEPTAVRWPGDPTLATLLPFDGGTYAVGRDAEGHVVRAVWTSR